MSGRLTKESPPSYNELYVPEIYLGRLDKTSVDGDDITVALEDLALTSGNSVGPEPLDDILTCNDEFYIHPTGRKVGCGLRPFFGQLRDGKNKILMTALSSNARDGRSGEFKFTTTRILDPTGKILMTIGRNDSVATLMTGDRILGLVHGLGTYGSKFTVENSAGETVMHILRKSSSSFVFIAQGGEVGRIESNPDQAGSYKVTLNQGLDIQTKARIVSSSYLLYVMYLINTSVGTGGTMAAGKRLCLLEFTMPFLFLIIIILILCLVYGLSAGK